VGTGLPSAHNTHEVAQAVAPESRVVYVDAFSMDESAAGKTLRISFAPELAGQGQPPE
jgi:S-adenosyl methyltransferase